MTKYKSIVQKLQKHYPDADQVIIFNYNGKSLFYTKEFNISSDLKTLIASWRSGRGASVTVNGIKYSLLQQTPDRLVATNRHKKGHLIGATTPDKNIYVLAHVKPKAKGWYHYAYPSVARAAAMIQDSSFEASFEPKMEVPRNSSTNNNPTMSYTVQIPQVDPGLKAEIEGFLQWIKIPTGLQAYITNALNVNDYSVISRLSSIYKELYDICHN
ncbi:MAG: hypothetical protein ACFFBP_08020 [Promethearchaeota archaeon]